MCPKHGSDFLEYKCRYCCSVAVFFCFGTTHFCNQCHDDFQRVTNIPKTSLPHCPAGQLHLVCSHFPRVSAGFGGGGFVFCTVFSPLFVQGIFLLLLFCTVSSPAVSTGAPHPVWTLFLLLVQTTDSRWCHSHASVCDDHHINVFVMFMTPTIS